MFAAYHTEQFDKELVKLSLDEQHIVYRFEKKTFSKSVSWQAASFNLLKREKV